MERALRVSHSPFGKGTTDICIGVCVCACVCVCVCVCVCACLSMTLSVCFACQQNKQKVFFLNIFKILNAFFHKVNAKQLSEQICLGNEQTVYNDN